MGRGKTKEHKHSNSKPLVDNFSKSHLSFLDSHNYTYIYASFHFQSHRGYIIILILFFCYKGYIIIYSLIISQMFLIWCHNFLIQYPTTHAMCVSVPLNYNSCVFHWTSLSFLPKTWLSDCYVSMCYHFYWMKIVDTVRQHWNGADDH
jgi:hypothetical protein